MLFTSKRTLLLRHRTLFIFSLERTQLAFLVNSGRVVTLQTSELPIHKHEFTPLFMMVTPNTSEKSVLILSLTLRKRDKATVQSKGNKSRNAINPL